MVLSALTPKTSSKGVVKKFPSPAFLKHGIQFEKLQQKSALETAAIEGIRHVLKQKAILEKDCAMAVQKLLTQYLSRKEFLSYLEILHGSQNVSTGSQNASVGEDGKVASETTEAADSRENLTLAELWKDGIAEMQKQQSLKITACEEVIKLTSEDLKAAKLARSLQIKRGIDVALEIQKEVDSVAERVTLAKKNYSECEKIVQEMQHKTRKLEEKSKKGAKAVKIPEKITSLLSTELPKATAARNEYILSVTGVNAFLAQYYSHDLAYIVDMINGNMYDVMTSTLTSVFETEQRLVPASSEFYEKFIAKIKKLSNKKDIDSFISTQPSLKESVRYCFEPVPGDTISVITTVDESDLSMDKCARKWALRWVEGDSAQQKLLQQLESLQSQVALETAEGQAAMDLKTFALKESLRRAAVYQLQAKDILEVLRKGKVDVERWMESARQAMEQKLLGSDGPEIIPTFPPSTLKHQKSSLATAMESSEKADNLSASGSSVTDGGIAHGGATQVRCVALYHYSADRPDELSFVANQELLLLSGTTDDEWLCVEDASGQQGYVPANYVTILGTDDVAESRGIAGADYYRSTSDYSAGWNDEPATPSGWEQQISSWGTEEQQVPSWEAGTEQFSYEAETYATTSATGSDSDLYAFNSDNSVATMEFSALTNLTDNMEGAGYCRALYDYGGQDPEDLSFQEGDIIRIISKISDSGVDDGYWKGELNGKTGLFLSVLAEDLTDSDRTSDLGMSISSTSSPLPAQSLASDSLPPPMIPPRAPKF